MSRPIRKPVSKDGFAAAPTRNDPRLDLLIYAHDGRGLGHASRGVAIGLAVRRLFPALKVLFVSGCKHTGALTGIAPLDWIKLPSYEKIVVDGAPRGRIGNTNLKNSYLVKSRTRLIRAIVGEYRPRCVLVDHEAAGKRDELLPAIGLGTDTRWVLGLRAVIGNVADVWSATATATFKKHYTALLWYGDAAVLGPGPLQAIRHRYHVEPKPTGYISRLRELTHWEPPPAETDPPLAGTIAVSWHTETSMQVLQNLRAALGRIGDRYGRWHVFADFGHPLFSDLPFCRVENLSARYLSAIANSRTAVVYGGYNSLADLLSVNIPAVVLLRDIADREQEHHVKKLAACSGASLQVLPEMEASPDHLQAALEKQLNSKPSQSCLADINGAETTAKIIAELIRRGDC